MVNYVTNVYKINYAVNNGAIFWNKCPKVDTS